MQNMLQYFRLFACQFSSHFSPTASPAKTYDSSELSCEPNPCIVGNCTVDDGSHMCTCSNLFLTCTLDYRPVCGTDEKTYPNICSLYSKICASNKPIEFHYSGECGEYSDRGDSYCVYHSIQKLHTLQHHPIIYPRCSTPSNVTRHHNIRATPFISV